MPAVLRPELLLLEQELGQPRDRCERVVELMRHARDELPHRGELLALDQLRLQRLLIRHVLDQHHDALVARRGGGAAAGGVDADRTTQRRRAAYHPTPATPPPR